MTQHALATATDAGFDAGKVALIKRTVAKNLNDDQFAMFLNTCVRTGLDPVMKQIYSLPIKGQAMTFIGIDGFRSVAERTGHYRGQQGPFFCGDDGIWTDVWLSDKPPRAARVGVLRDDFDEPLFAVAHWQDYARNTETWKNLPCVMLAKVAEALAIRRAFPMQLVGTYERSEMDQATEPRNVTPASSPETDKPKRARKKAPAQVVETRKPEPEVVDVESAPAEPASANGAGKGKTPEERVALAVKAYGLDATLVERLTARFDVPEERVTYLKRMVVETKGKGPDEVRQHIESDMQVWIGEVL